MNLSVFEKIFTVLKYSFSSFLEIELFIFCLLFFILMLLNIKKNNKIVKYGSLVFITLGILVLIFTNTEYAVYCLDKVIKLVMNYFYFPSPVVFFFIFIFTNIMLIAFQFNDKINKIYKIASNVIFMMIDFLFLSYYSLIIYLKIDLTKTPDLYKDNTILSIVQVSNILFFGWLLVSLFYLLYLLFKKKFDKKIEN